MKLIATIISPPNKPIFQLSLRDNIFGWLVSRLSIFENMGYVHPIAPRWVLNRIVKIYFDVQKKREALEKQ